MILIQRGIMNIPEDERFVGFAGDNLCLSKTFLVEDEPAGAEIYKLFLTFDNTACNYFELEKTVENGTKKLTWHIREEHIFKSGVVRAQIKAYSSSGEIWHSSSDWFVVDDSAEFSDYFSNKENSEFLDYERKLRALKAEIDDVLRKMPYEGQDDYWYVYSSASDSFVKAAAVVPNAMELASEVNVSRIGDIPRGQLFTCQGSILLKTGASAEDYKELARASAVCPVTRTVAGLPLTSDISVSALKAALGLE